jgi:dTDP-glucose pyrophosphorylase
MNETFMTSAEVAAYLIDENLPVLEALAKIDRGSGRSLFVQKEGRLLAALTDGDIRRHILGNGDLKAPVSEVANYHPLFLSVDEQDKAAAFMREHSIEGVPLVDSEGRIVDIATWKELMGHCRRRSSISAPVVMMAGGKGTRLFPYTKILPKPLIPIGEIPISEHIINRFYAAGCVDFYLIVNYKKNMLKAYYNELDKDYNVYFADEDKPLGTGGGLSLLKGKIKETFFLTNCDILIQEDYERIYRFHKENNNKITMVCSLKNFQIPYGVIKLGGDGEIASMTEKPHVPFLTNTGCYVVEPDVIADLPDNTSFGFPDVVQHYQDKGENVGVFPIGENAWLDMGVPEEMERMKEKLGV